MPIDAAVDAATRVIYTCPMHPEIDLLDSDFGEVREGARAYHSSFSAEPGIAGG